jgi:hypothetical protein
VLHDCNADMGLSLACNLQASRKAYEHVAADGATAIMELSRSASPIGSAVMKLPQTLCEVRRRDLRRAKRVRVWLGCRRIKRCAGWCLPFHLPYTKRACIFLHRA